MKIWVTRHGQTNLNLKKLMQGRTDEPLNDTGIAQAQSMREKLMEHNPGLQFDAVYSSPLIRAVKTASIIGAVSEEKIIKDERIIEADFGRYEMRKYYLVGLRMSLYWALPELFPAPPTVESVDSMIRRSHAFLKEIEQKDYDNVLVTCHGGILRVLSGYLSDNPRGYVWRPRPHNCEIRVFEVTGGKHTFLQTYSLHEQS